MQNLKFKTCIINGQERYIFATMDESEQTAEMPAQMFPESLLSFMDLDMSRVSALFSAMNNCMAYRNDSESIGGPWNSFS